MAKWSEMTDEQKAKHNAYVAKYRRRKATEKKAGKRRYRRRNKPKYQAINLLPEREESFSITGSPRQIAEFIRNLRQEIA